jgi:hypothetical protein
VNGVLLFRDRYATFICVSLQSLVTFFASLPLCRREWPFCFPGVVDQCFGCCVDWGVSCLVYIIFIYI